MQDLSGLFLTESIALAACGAIAKNPDSALTSGALVKILHGNVSKGNASKNISALKKLGILDESDVPTELGKNGLTGKLEKRQRLLSCRELFRSGSTRLLPRKLVIKNSPHGLPIKKK